jgi:hypothetical protein
MQFLARFGRSYASKSDFDVRYDIFAENFTAIEEHNSNPAVTFVKGVNQFTDMSEQELEARFSKTALKKPAQMINKKTEAVRLSLKAYPSTLTGTKPVKFQSQLIRLAAALAGLLRLQQL